MKITKTFNTHIRLSNIDKNGIQQVLYPETTADDVKMSDGTTLTNYFLNANKNITFKQKVGIMFKDSLPADKGGPAEYPGIVQNSSNLWIGAAETKAYHHYGITCISAGWSYNESNKVVGNDTIRIVVPYDSTNSVNGKPDNGNAYHVLHNGNYSKYAIPTKGSTDVSGNIGFNKSGIGIYVTDSVNRSYAGLFDNGTNLWIGASSGKSYHHTGKTYISSGWDGSAGNSTIYVSVPSQQTPPNDDQVNNYAVCHSGNLVDIMTTYLYPGSALIQNSSENIMLNRVPITNLTEDDEGIVSKDTYKTVDDYGKISIKTNKATDKIAIEYEYNTLYYKYNVFYFELYNNGSSAITVTSNDIILTYDDDSEIKKKTIFKNDVEKVTISPNNRTYSNVVRMNDTSTMSERYIKKVKIILSVSTSCNLSLHTFCGNSVAGVSHLRSYNHMLSDILARLWRLENDTSHLAFTAKQVNEYTDLNNYTTAGVYFFSRIKMNNDDRNYGNMPKWTIDGKTNEWVNGYLIVIREENFVKQIALRQGTLETNDYETCVRTKNADSWSSWTMLSTK